MSANDLSRAVRENFTFTLVLEEAIEEAWKCTCDKHIAKLCLVDQLSGQNQLEDFNRVVSQLNTLGSLSEAREFLNTHVVPEYHWADHEETAERFMAAVEQRFG